MLAAYRIFLVPLIALFFSIVLSGSITLQLKTQLHSALGGILTGVMVLFVLLFGDAKKLGLFGGREDEDGSDYGGGPEVGQSSLDRFSQDTPMGE